MLGGSARPSEVREQLVRNLGISEEAQEDTLPSGFPRLDNQIAWARFYLANAGIIDSSARGVWTLTERGRSLSHMTHEEAIELFKAVHKRFQADRKRRRQAVVEEGDVVPPQDAELSTTENYRQQLLDRYSSGSTAVRFRKILPTSLARIWFSGGHRNRAFRRRRHRWSWHSSSKPISQLQSSLPMQALHGTGDSESGS